jgi:hypothetical protein
MRGKFVREKGNSALRAVMLSTLLVVVVMGCEL